MHVLHGLFSHCCDRITRRKAFLFPRITSALNTLRTGNLPLNLIAGGPAPFITPLLRTLSVTGCFDIIVNNSSIRGGGPRPSPLLLITRQVKVTPRRVLFINSSHGSVRTTGTTNYPSINLACKCGCNRTVSLDRPSMVCRSVGSLLPTLKLPRDRGRRSGGSWTRHF